MSRNAGEQGRLDAGWSIPSSRVDMQQSTWWRLDLRVGILTSTDTRHRYFVNALRRRCRVVAVCYQDTAYAPASVADAGVDARTARIVRQHFDERSRQELAYFGSDAEAIDRRDSCAVMRADCARLNSPETLEFLQSQGVEAVAVYGTSLIREPLLGAYAGRMLNLHLGLSPYYRGTATNFYPLVNDEPEYVGATIHLIDAGIDSGPIVHHARPDITADDMPHTAGCKAILAGIEKMTLALEELAAGRLTSTPQWKPERSRVYLRRDYRPEHVVRLYELIEQGLFARYIERRPRVENAMRLIA